MKHILWICLLELFSFHTYSQKTVQISHINIIDVEKGIVKKDMNVFIKDAFISDIIPGNQQTNLPKSDTVINGKVNT